MENPKSKADQIFISYRRSDTAGVAGRIYDRLIQSFGKSAVFKDVDSIPLGINFKQHLDSVVEQCSVVIVIIGERWLEKDLEAGHRRMDDPRDFVRIELESALRRGIPVIPLLVENASVPSENELPATLQELAYRHGMVVGHDPHFHTDMDRLIKNLEALFGNTVDAKDQASEASTPRLPSAAASPGAKTSSEVKQSTTPKFIEKKGGKRSLWIVPVLLLTLWFLSFALGMSGGLIHLLLVLATGWLVVSLLLRLRDRVSRQ